MSAVTEAEVPNFLQKTYGQLSENPYFAAGFGLAGVGMAASITKRAIIISNAVFRRKFLTSISVNNEDASFPWVLDYINKHSNHKARSITAHSLIKQSESGRTELTFNFLPGHGTHYFTYKYRFILAERQREEQSIQRNGIRTPLETVTLTTLGTDPLFWKQFLNNAVNDALAMEEKGLVVYHAVGPEWRRMGNPRRKRPLSSVILDNHLSKKIINDVQEFVNSERWYIERGAPYRRGYLLYGPPGTGKTSFIAALAGHFGYSICMLSLSERTLDDDRLSYLLNNAPSNSLILLEDIDAAFVSRDLYDNAQHRAYEGMTRVTFSGLLNAIDGIASAEQRLLFMTTNNVDRLDAALIRPGRVDVKEYFGNCTDEMLQKMFSKFYENASQNQSEQFSSLMRVHHSTISPAQVQGFLMLYKFDPAEALKHVVEFTIQNNVET